MKMTATIEVEFEDDGKFDPGRARYNLEEALRRGAQELESAIEYGIENACIPTGIRRGVGTTSVKVSRSQIVEL
jgi:hypothetical protein